MIKFLNLFIKGIFVGVANIIPGVSGGTIAVVLNIFDKMIDAVNNFFKEPKKHIKFLLPLGIGAIFGIGIFSKIIEICLTRFSFPTTMFFVGLVVGSIPLIYSQAKKKGVKPAYYIYSVVAFFIVILMSLSSAKESSSAVNISFFGLFKIFIFGVISSSAMVIPGISGSFVMVLLGLYNVLLSSISGFLDTLANAFSLISTDGFIASVSSIFKSEHFIILFAVGLGIIFGIILISKIIALLLQRAFSATYFSILGLIFGSIFAIFNDPITYQSYSASIPLSSIISAILIFILGFFISFKMSKAD